MSLFYNFNNPSPSNFTWPRLRISTLEHNDPFNFETGPPPALACAAFSPANGDHAWALRAAAQPFTSKSRTMRQGPTAGDHLSFLPLASDCLPSPSIHHSIPHFCSCPDNLRTEFMAALQVQTKLSSNEPGVCPPDLRGAATTNKTHKTLAPGTGPHPVYPLSYPSHTPLPAALCLVQEEEVPLIPFFKACLLCQSAKGLQHHFL
ncbi:hypothetical protein Q5P01_021742 [Channa striata]|uniref:Uncharacterized protein n=1 Tax=Channa striata TaxID=64152 RepID=A0AA88LUP3_CHASR|nr:hypothetical protein Q5P01_021742 [Channa striata]